MARSYLQLEQQVDTLAEAVSALLDYVAELKAAREAGTSKTPADRYVTRREVLELLGHDVPPAEAEEPAPEPDPSPVAEGDGSADDGALIPELKGK